MRVTEDGVWRYYNCPDPFWSAKCRACREKVGMRKAPVEECLNCWKVEIWRPTPADFSPLVDSLLIRGTHVIAKASRAPILIVRSGIPLRAYPPDTVDYMLMLYASRIAERDLLLQSASEALAADEAGEGGRSSPPGAPQEGLPLPFRRGCWRYDEVLGPWQAWYPPDQDYRGDLPRQ
jgi:hypothetical protein